MERPSPKRLCLLRHAHAADAGALGDHERVLSGQGEREAEAVGAHMAALHLFPQFILSSSSVRTLQTMRTVASALLYKEGHKMSSRCDRALYLASAGELLREIEGVDDNFGTLLVVAHNPGIAELAAYLGANASSFPPGALAVFNVNALWSGTGPETAEFVEMFVP
jgi:phosphohistidine phosphatase